MKLLILSFSFLLIAFCSNAQQVIDTINTDNLKLNTTMLKEGKSTYAVMLTDSIGNRMGAAQLWDRTIKFTKDAARNTLYQFEWKWYMKDSLFGTVLATGLLASMKPLTHHAVYAKRGENSFVFNDGVVTVPDGDKKNKADSNFKVVLKHPAFEFPMDLEIFGLLPFKKTGQQFAIAFYEPGSPKSDYYKLTVTGKEDLAMPGGTVVKCWLLKIDYGIANAYATFWISDKTREVLKMAEVYRNIRRYKVKLY